MVLWTICFCIFLYVLLYVPLKPVLCVNVASTTYIDLLCLPPTSSRLPLPLLPYTSCYRLLPPNSLAPLYRVCAHLTGISPLPSLTISSVLPAVAEPGGGRTRHVTSRHS